MAYVISVLTFLLFLLSLALFIFSRMMQRLLMIFFQQDYYKYILLFRLLAGFIIVAAAPESGAPFLMNLIGIAIIFVALITPLASDELNNRLENWWMSLNGWQLRLWSLLWMFIWLLLSYLALPDNQVFNSLL